MVQFDTEEEKDYFHNTIMIGEVARSTMIKIFDKLETVESITRNEVFQMQKDAIIELKTEADKLEEEEKQQIQNETEKKEADENNKH